MRVERMEFTYPTADVALEAFQLFVFRNFADLIEFNGETGTGADREIKFKITSTGMIFSVMQNQLRIFNSTDTFIYTTGITVQNASYQAVNFDGQIALMSGGTPILMTVRFDDGSAGILTGTTFVYHGHAYSYVVKDNGLNMGQKMRLGAVYNAQINTILKNTFNFAGAFNSDSPTYMRIGDELLITAGNGFAIHQINKGGF